MDYKGLYEQLYRKGYHDKGKNHAIKYTSTVLRYPFKNIIDLGCSNGRFVKNLQRNRRNAYGLDISGIAISWACEKHGAINCIKGNITDIPFRNKYFEAVFSCDVLEHLTEEHVDIALSEIDRICQKYFFVTICHTLEHNTEFLEKVHEQGFFLDVENLHLTVKPVKWWIDKIKNHGFKHIETNSDLLIFKRKK